MCPLLAINNAASGMEFAYIPFNARGGGLLAQNALRLSRKKLFTTPDDCKRNLWGRISHTYGVSKPSKYRLIR